MILSKKKIFYIRMVLANNMLARMRKSRMISDLKDYGIIIDENCDLDADSIKEIYKVLIKHVNNKYTERLVD